MTVAGSPLKNHLSWTGPLKCQHITVLVLIGSNASFAESIVNILTGQSVEMGSTMHVVVMVYQFYFAPDEPNSTWSLRRLPWTHLTNDLKKA